MTSLDGFEVSEFTDGDITHPVYFRGAGPGVLLMHELPGMVPQCVELATFIARQGFTVFMPLLFGEPGAPPATARLALHVCISREFRCFAHNESSPITRLNLRTSFSWRGRIEHGRVRPDPRRSSYMSIVDDLVNNLFERNTVQLKGDFTIALVDGGIKLTGNFNSVLRDRVKQKDLLNVTGPIEAKVNVKDIVIPVPQIR